MNAGLKRYTSSGVLKVIKGIQIKHAHEKTRGFCMVVNAGNVYSRQTCLTLYRLLYIRKTDHMDLNQ